MQPLLACARPLAPRACRKAAPHALESICNYSPPACTLQRGSLEAGLVEQEVLQHLQALTASLCRASAVTQCVVFFLASPPADQQALLCVRILRWSLQDTDNLLTSVGCGFLFFQFVWLPPSPQNAKPSSLLVVAVRFSWLLAVFLGFVSFLCFADSFNSAVCPETLQSGKPRADSTPGQPPVLAPGFTTGSLFSQGS